jgi:hypothetical protein
MGHGNSVVIVIIGTDSGRVTISLGSLFLLHFDPLTLLLLSTLLAL